MVIFHSYVSLPEGTPDHVDQLMDLEVPYFSDKATCPKKGEVDGENWMISHGLAVNMSFLLREDGGDRIVPFWTFEW